MGKNKSSNQVRIIAGQWRGRRLAVCDWPDLRPTGDRVRETLFNWLRSEIGGARCLDLFCGSGALGLEALSRGAQSVVFVDQAEVVITHLKKQTGGWPGIGGAEFIVSDAMSWLEGASSNFDLVFLDPPFDLGSQLSCLTLLIDQNRVTHGGLIYIESPTSGALDPSDLPSGTTIERQKTFGQVSACLIRYH